MQSDRPDCQSRGLPQPDDPLSLLFESAYSPERTMTVFNKIAEENGNPVALKAYQYASNSICLYFRTKEDVSKTKEKFPEIQALLMGCLRFLATSTRATPTCTARTTEDGASTSGEMDPPTSHSAPPTSGNGIENVGNPFGCGDYYPIENLPTSDQDPPTQAPARPLGYENTGPNHPDFSKNTLYCPVLSKGVQFTLEEFNRIAKFQELPEALRIQEVNNSLVLLEFANEEYREKARPVIGDLFPLSDSGKAPPTGQAPPTSQHAPPTSQQDPPTPLQAPPTSQKTPPTSQQAPPTSSDLRHRSVLCFTRYDPSHFLYSYNETVKFFRNMRSTRFPLAQNVHRYSEEHVLLEFQNSKEKKHVERDFYKLRSPDDIANLDEDVRNLDDVQSPNSKVQNPEDVRSPDDVRVPNSDRRGPEDVRSLDDVRSTDSETWDSKNVTSIFPDGNGFDDDEPMETEPSSNPEQSDKAEKSSNAEESGNALKYNEPSLSRQPEVVSESPDFGESESADSEVHEPKRPKTLIFEIRDSEGVNDDDDVLEGDPRNPKKPENVNGAPESSRELEEGEILDSDDEEGVQNWEDLLYEDISEDEDFAVDVNGIRNWEDLPYEDISEDED